VDRGFRIQNKKTVYLFYKKHGGKMSVELKAEGE
jgi:hypothetical protein